MKRLFFLILIVVSGCNPGGNITRTLRFVDLNEDQNQSFQQYPNEFSYFILDAVMKGSLTGFDIDYQTGNSPVVLPVDSLFAVLTDIFYDDEVDAFSAGSYLSMASLIALDEIHVGGNYHNTNYITFYFPGEVTPEGIHRQFCSVIFQDALDILDDLDPPVVWFQYKNRDWGWIKDEVFQPDYLSSNQLGISLANKQKSDSLFLNSSVAPDLFSLYSSDDRFVFGTTLSNGVGELFFHNEDTSVSLGRFSTKHLSQLTEDTNDSLWIMPIALAFEQQQFESLQDRVISENGMFQSPLQGKDKLSLKSRKKLKVGKSPFKPNQKFKYRTIERIVYNDRPDISHLILDALRHGEISAYESDSLKTRKQSGKFFDEMVIDDLENIKVIDQLLIEVALVVKELTFDMNGKVIQQIQGVGLIAPGKHVPEGFDRTLGYFKIEDVTKFMTSAELRGLPLQSSYIVAIN